MKEKLVTLTQIEFYCERHDRLIGGLSETGDEFWISAGGAHAPDMSYDEVRVAVEGATAFEIREIGEEFDEPDVTSYLDRVQMQRELELSVH